MASPPKRSAESKRTARPRASDFTRQFQKDWERLSKSGRFDIIRLKTVMMLIIANDAPLPAERRDHSLTGDWADHREGHVGGDFLLIYKLGAADGEVVFVRTGTHAELFG